MPAFRSLRFCVKSILLLGLLLNPLAAQRPVTQVIVARAEVSQVIEEVPLTGTVISPRTARLTPETGGLIESLAVDIGDRVEQGGVILQLRSDMERLALDAKQAQTEQARQELADARRRLADAERLGKTRTVSANEIQSLAAEVKIDGAVVKRLLAEEQQQALVLQQHTLTAPFAGVVSQKHAERGEWVTPGQAVVDLVDTDQLVIEFHAPQSVYSRLDKVQRLVVRFEARPGESHEARISAIVPITDRESRTFIVRARLIDDTLSLIPGMSASATLHIGTATQGVVVQRNAILRYPDGRVTVWVVNEQDGRTTVSEQRVNTGLSFNGRVSITDGLQQDARVVVEGNEALREGQEVRVVDARD